MAVKHYAACALLMLINTSIARMSVSEVAGISNMGPLSEGKGFVLGAYPASRHSSISYERVYRVPLDGGPETFWQTLVSATDIKVAPDGQHVAFREGRIVTDSGEDLRAVLRVVDASGNSVRALPDVYAYDWSPDGQSLVCIRGTSMEDYPGFDSTGVFIMPLRTDELVKIYDCGLDVAWAGFDGNLYIKHNTRTPVSVFRYNYQRATIEETPYKGINFSPNGALYYSSPFDLDTGVYRTADGVDLLAKSSVLGKTFRVGRPLGWLDDEHVVFAATDLGGTRCVIYSVAADTAFVAPGPAVLLESGALAVWDSGTVRTTTFSALPVVTDTSGATRQQEEKEQ